MRTDNLIAALAHDAPAPAPALTPRALGAFAAAAAVVGVLFALAIGPRADMAAAAAQIATAAKIGLTALLAAGGLAAALRLSRPGATARAALAPIGAAVAGLMIWIAAEFAVRGADGWAARMIGDNAVYCLTLIPLLALLPLAALIAAMRLGAPTQPAGAGALAGLAAAGVAAAIYATHCTDDSPLFLLAWYSLASALVAGLGALLGARLLRW